MRYCVVNTVNMDKHTFLSPGKEVWHMSQVDTAGKAKGLVVLCLYSSTFFNSFPNKP